MHLNLYTEKSDLFSIVATSLLFHFLIIASLLIVIWLRPAKEPPPPIPFFEMVNVVPPPPSKPIHKSRPAPVPEPVAEPVPVKPELKPEIKPEPKPVSKLETKQQPRSAAEPASPTESQQPAAAPMDMPMDLPSDVKSKNMDMPAMRTIGNVIMDAELQAYLNRLVMLLYQNFNPPSGTEVARGTKASVQFQIARNGEISSVVLRSSSGSQIWDRLAVRAVQITKPPPLPPSYVAEDLPLIFDFREK
jgi:protein TonB